jgi:hypothetical protein
VSENLHDEQHLADLIAALPPVPDGWVQAAKVLPFARASLDGFVERARADAEYRERVVADLESALAAAGFEPDRHLVKALRRNLSQQI